MIVSFFVKSSGHFLIYTPILVIIDSLIYSGVGSHLKDGVKYACPKRVIKIILLKD